MSPTGILKSWPRCSKVPDKVQLKPLSLYAKLKVSVLAVGCETLSLNRSV